MPGELNREVSRLKRRKGTKRFWGGVYGANRQNTNVILKWQVCQKCMTVSEIGLAHQINQKVAENGDSLGMAAVFWVDKEHIDGRNLDIW